MKIVQINSVPNGSTGKIMFSIHNRLKELGYDSYVVWGRGRKSNNKSEIFLNDNIGVKFHALYTRLTGKTGFASKKSTKKLVKLLNQINPDIIHLHNIHGYYINLDILFDYLKRSNVRVIWTLHDCWPFTGQCPHFMIKQCDKWMTGCYNCPMIHEYPKTIKDNSKWNYTQKKKMFLGLNMIIVTPSNWLNNLAKKSFLGKYEIITIHNGIDLNVFKKTPSCFRKKYNLDKKIIILGVSSVWDTRKGLKDFVRLSKILDDNYAIVLIGLTNKQISSLPKNIIGITKTENQRELAEIYTAADILFNPTYEDNYPTVNLESIACNTKVITYDTGGCKEQIESFDFGYIVDKKDYETIIKILDEISLDENFKSPSCGVSQMIKDYINLY